MPLRIALLWLVLAIVPPSAAFAALSAEQAQGGSLSAQLGSGSKTCADLSRADLDHIGEYAMGRMLGSASLHQAMDDRMALMLGAGGEARMHQLLGARVGGCVSQSSYGAMDPGMMSGYSAADGVSGSSDWSWMRGGAWRHMSRAGWQRVEDRLASPAVIAGSHHGTGSWWIVAVAVFGIVLAAVAVAWLVSRACRPPAAPSSP